MLVDVTRGDGVDAVERRQKSVDQSREGIHYEHHPVDQSACFDLFVLNFLDGFSGFGVARVDDLRVMRDNAFDQALRFQFLKSEARQTASDLQALGDHGGSDQLVGRNFFHEFLQRRFVKEDQVVELVSDFSL